MEITLELVERLREKAPVSYTLAKEALEYSGGNLLDALIYLEEKGAIPRQEVGRAKEVLCRAGERAYIIGSVVQGEAGVELV